MNSQIGLRRLAVFLLLANCAFVAVFLGSIWFGKPHAAIHGMFDLDGESTLPAWFTSAQLLLTGALFFASGSAPAIPAKLRSFMYVVGAGFVFLSADESASIHENITRILRPVEAMPSFADGHGIWIPIYLGLGVIFIAVTAQFWRRLWQLERQGATIFASGIALFVIGAVGIEILSYGDLRHAGLDGTYAVLVAIEEFFELCGASAVFMGILHIHAGLTKEHAHVPFERAPAGDHPLSAAHRRASVAER